MPRQIYLSDPAYISDMMDVDDSGYVNAFLRFSRWLSPLGITYSDAINFFQIDYNTAKTMYTREAIIDKIVMVSTTHAKKYDKLLAAYQAEYDPISNYDRIEESTHTRTPDLQKQATSSGTTSGTHSADTSNTIRQTRTTTTTPQNFQTTTEHDVAPFDSTTYQPQTKDTTTETGSTATTEAYTGQPDLTETTGTDSSTSSGTATETETGTETTKIDSHISGNIGVTSSQKMLNDEINLAQRMIIWLEIERDIAAAICIQVW